MDINNIMRKMPHGFVITAGNQSTPYPCSDQQPRDLKQESFQKEMRNRIKAMAEAIDMLQDQLNRIERGLQYV